MSASLLPPRSAEVSDIMEAAKRVFRATLPKCLPLSMLATLLFQMASLYDLARGKQPDLFKPHDATFWILFAIGFASWQLLAAIIMLRQRSIIAGRLPEWNAEWRIALQRWLPLLVAALLSGLVMTLGLVLLVAPGIYAFVCFVLVRPVVLFEKIDPLRALERCFHLARPRWLKFCAVAVMGALIFAVCALALVVVLSLLAALLAGAGVKAEAINAVGAAVLLGFLSVASVYFSALWLALYAVASSSA